MGKHLYLITVIIFWAMQTQAQEIQLTISKKIEGNATVIYGTTNLPDGTKLGVSLTKGSESGPQDYNIFVKNGYYESLPMTAYGNRLDSSYTVHVFTYFNQMWQRDESIREKLKSYTSPNLTPTHATGLKFEITKKLGDL